MHRDPGSIRRFVVPAAVCAAAAVGVASLAAARRALPPPSGGDLRDLFAVGWMLQDRNEDDLVDFVDGAIVLPDEPSEVEVVVAANVAARLGFETTALRPGLSVAGDRDGGWDGPVVLVGVGGDGVVGGVDMLPPLAPGWGALERVAVDDHYRSGGVRLSGYDASGLLAAGAYLSGRYPGVWAVEGVEWAAVMEDVEEALAEVDVTPDSLHLGRIVVDGAAPGVRSAWVDVFVGSMEAMDVAADRLSGLGAPATPPDSADEEAAPSEPFEVSGVDRFDFRVVGPDEERMARARSSDPGSANAGGNSPSRQLPAFDLGDFYSLDGVFRDGDGDFVPDRIDAYLSVAGGESHEGVVGLGARLGLESAGGRFPIAEVAGASEEPAAEAFPIVIGADHWQALAQSDAGALPLGPLGAGEGMIQVIEEGFGDRNGMVVTGAGAAGVGAVLDHLAWRNPYLWEYGKGRFRLDDVTDEVRRFLQAVDGPGQTALALAKLDGWLARVDTLGPIDSLHVELAAKGAPSALESILVARLRDAFPSASVSATVHDTGFGVGDTIFVQDVDLPWEVDQVRALLRESVYPRLTGGASGRIEVRVSEPPEVREALEDEIRAAVGEADGDGGGVEVVVLSAYKQGYSWLVDQVLPELRGLGVDRIRIAYHTLRDSEEVRWQTIAAETRWLQELWPVDAVLARELAIPDSAITFHATRDSDPIYRVEALAADGSVLLEREFTPRYVVRPYFNLFPGYEQIRVTTGWVTAEVDGETVVDERVRTDPEAFWDLLQTDTYGRMLEYVMDLQDGRPSSQNAPFFDEFRVDLALSEPDYRIGVDEEVISSLEALHEDIYFETLTFFDRIGEQWSGSGLNYIGRVLPWIRQTAEPGPGTLRITFTGKQEAIPEIRLAHRVEGGEVETRSYPLSGLPTDDPRLSGMVVRVAEEGIARMLYEVEASDSASRYEEFRARSSEAGIDRQFLSVDLLRAMTSELRELQEAGLFTDAVAFDRVGEIRFRFTLEDDTTGWEAFETVARTSRPASTARPVPEGAEGWSWNGERIVQWDTPIPPGEAEELVAKLGSFPEATPWWAGESFLGRDVWALDLMPPHDTRYISQAKRNALRPTILLSGRQHANEVSSTSHILRLGEVLVTEPEARELLKKVNVVLHPITNPDGAQLAYDMQLENPDFMLHAGYLGSLGVDATSGGGDDPIYPESKVRPLLRDMWLPDVYLNLHGYPSHEWVQLFAGYSAWVQSRSGGQRSWWAPRGWFIPGFSWVDEDEDADIHRAQFAMLDTIAAAITSLPEVEAMNRRMYERYAKYGRQEREGFTEYFHNGILVNQSLSGRGAGNGSTSAAVTALSITTEAPDETARGEWLELVASAGLAHTSALTRYLAGGEYPVEREAEAYDGLVTRSAARVRPVLPPGVEREGGEGGRGGGGGG